MPYSLVLPMFWSAIDYQELDYQTLGTVLWTAQWQDRRLTYQWVGKNNVASDNLIRIMWVMELTF